MPVSKAVLQDHIAYTAWASRRLLEAAATLTAEELNKDFGTADRSVFGTLYHVFAADTVWLSRLQGVSPSSFPQRSDSSLPALELSFPALHYRWRTWAAALTDESAGAEIAYTDLKGKDYKQPIWQIVFHVVNHATHHRGQVSGFLRNMGHTPPVLDFIYYQRQKPQMALLDATPGSERPAS